MHVTAGDRSVSFLITALMPEALVCVRAGMRGEPGVTHTHAHAHGAEWREMRCDVSSMRSCPQPVEETLPSSDPLSLIVLPQHVHLRTHTHTQRAKQELSWHPVMFAHDKGSAWCHFYCLPVINTYSSFSLQCQNLSSPTTLPSL